MVRQSVVRAWAVGLLVVVLSLGGAVPSWADDAFPPMTVTGTVYVDGKPSQGVGVCDYWMDDRCSITDANGRYSVVLEAKPRGGPEQIVYCLALQPKAGQHLKSRALALWDFRNCVPRSAGQTTATFDFTEKTQPVTVGTVVDAAGRPIAGAVVSGNEPGTPDEVRVTGKDGRFRIWLGFDAGDNTTFRVEADGYQTAYRYQEAVLKMVGDVGRIVLAKAGQTDVVAFSGRVTDYQGHPVRGAEVRFAKGARIGYTDANGNYSGLTKSYTSFARFTTVVGRIEVRPGGGNAAVVSTFNCYAETDFCWGWNVRVRVLLSSKPVVVGVPRVGRTLVARAGVWTPAPVALRYQWFANGVKVKGATKSSLKLKRAVLGKRITVKVTGSKKGYHSISRASASTPRVR